MSKKITRGFLLAALAAAMTGCPDDPPTPDASRDVPGDRDVVNEASTDVPRLWLDGRYYWARARVYLAAREIVLHRLMAGPDARLEALKRRLALKHDWFVGCAQDCGSRLWRAGASELANELWREHMRLQHERSRRMLEAFGSRRPR